MNIEILKNKLEKENKELSIIVELLDEIKKKKELIKQFTDIDTINEAEVESGVEQEKKVNKGAISINMIDVSTNEIVKVYKSIKEALDKLEMSTTKLYSHLKNGENKLIDEKYKLMYA